MGDRGLTPDSSPAQSAASGMGTAELTPTNMAQALQPAPVPNASQQPVAVPQPHHMPQALQPAAVPNASQQPAAVPQPHHMPASQQPAPLAPAPSNLQNVPPQAPVPTQQLQNEPQQAASEVPQTEQQVQECLGGGCSLYYSLRESRLNIYFQVYIEYLSRTPLRFQALNIRV